MKNKIRVSKKYQYVENVPVATEKRAHRLCLPIFRVFPKKYQYVENVLVATAKRAHRLCYPIFRVSKKISIRRKRTVATEKEPIGYVIQFSGFPPKICFTVPLKIEKQIQKCKT
jgi:hypothetical protein